MALMLFGNLGRVPVLLRGPEVAIILNDLAVGAVLVVGALACLQARRLVLDDVCAAAGVFAFIGAGAALAAAAEYHLSASEVAFSATYLVRWVAYGGVYVVALNTGGLADADRVWRVLERTAVAFAAFGIVQSLFLPGFAQLVYPEGGNYIVWDVQGHRMVSTMLDPNFAGAFVALPLFVHLGRAAFGAPAPVWRPALLFAALAMTVSRSTALATITGLGVILAVRGVDRRVVRAAAFAGVAALPFAPFVVRFAASYNKFSVDQSAMARIVAWLRALEIFADHPVFGIGFNTYRYVQRAYGWDADGLSTLSMYSLDGGLLFVAVLTGVVGLAVYLTMLGLVVRRCRRLWRDPALDGAVRGTAVGVAAGTVAMVVHSIFVNSLLQNFLMETLWVLWGIVALYARGAAARSVAPNSAPNTARDASRAGGSPRPAVVTWR